ncbi:MAG: hypothetical protein PGN21_02640 [Sphingomonas paucimobilis]
MRAFRHVVDRRDDVADRLRLFRQRDDIGGNRFGLFADRIHRAGGVGDGGQPGVADLRGRLCLRDHFLRAAGDLRAAMRDLVDRCGGFLYGGKLFFNRCRLFLRRRADFGGRRVQVVGRGPVLCRDGAQAAHHVVQRSTETPEFVRAGRIGGGRQVAFADPPDKGHERVERPHDRTPRRHGDHKGDDDRDDQPEDDRDPAGGVNVAGRVAPAFDRDVQRLARLTDPRDGDGVIAHDIGFGRQHAGPVAGTDRGQLGLDIGPRLFERLVPRGQLARHTAP